MEQKPLNLVAAQGSVLSLGAASDAHPNKHPFSGVLCYFDVPSDKPVGGSNGRLVLIPSEVGIPALTSLEGMAVNVKYDFGGHDPKKKIGVIEKAWAGEPLENGAVPVIIEGYLYAADFPDEVADLKVNVEELGFSYETTDTLVVDIEGAVPPTCKVTQLTFTGASILYKNRAAYQTTQLAAQEDAMNETDIKKAQEPVEDTNTLNAADEAPTTEPEPTATEPKIDATRLADMLNAWEEFKKAFLGDGEDWAKWAKLTMRLEAAEEAEKANKELGERVEALEKALEDANTKIAELETTVTEKAMELEAAAEENPYARKSMVPTTLMAKYAVDEMDDYEKQIEAINKRTDLTIEERMALKLEARSKRPAENA